MNLRKALGTSYPPMDEIIPEQIWGDALIDAQNIFVFRGRAMPVGHAMALKGFRLKMLETACTFDEIAQGFNYSIWSLQIANQETKLRFPGSEFIDYLTKSIVDFTFEPVIVINELVYYQILIEFTSDSHWQPIHRSGIRVTLLGSHFIAK